MTDPAPPTGPKADLPAPPTGPKADLPTPPTGPKVDLPTPPTGPKVDIPAPPEVAGSQARIAPPVEALETASSGDTLDSGIPDPAGAAPAAPVFKPTQTQEPAGSSLAQSASGVNPLVAYVSLFILAAVLGFFIMRSLA